MRNRVKASWQRQAPACKVSFMHMLLNLPTLGILP